MNALPMPEHSGEGDLALPSVDIPTLPSSPMRGVRGFIGRFFPHRDRCFEADVRVQATGTDEGDALGRISKALRHGGLKQTKLLGSSELEG